MALSLFNIVSLILTIAPFTAAATPQQSLPGDPSCASTGMFMTSCAYPGLKFVDNALGMYCLNDNVNIYGYNWTWIDLNMCLTNNDAKLVPMHNGGYAGSCTNCQVSFTSSVRLTCDCLNLSGKSTSQTTIDLNLLIYNTDGTMGCCEHLGNKTWKGPQVQ